MDTIAKKGRYFLLAAAILAWLGAVGVVCNQIVSTILSRIVTEQLGTVLGIYNQISAGIGAVFGNLTPCVLLLLAAAKTEGRTKAGLALLAAGGFVSGAATVALFFMGTADTAYQINMIVGAVCGLLRIAGGVVIAADRQNSGTVRGIAVASAVFALLSALTLVGVNFCGYLYLRTYEIEPWIRLLTHLSSVRMFVSIIASVLTGTLYMLLYALPTVRRDEPAEETKEEPETP